MPDTAHTLSYLFSLQIHEVSIIFLDVLEKKKKSSHSSFPSTSMSPFPPPDASWGFRKRSYLGVPISRNVGKEEEGKVEGFSRNSVSTANVFTLPVYWGGLQEIMGELDLPASGIPTRCHYFHMTTSWRYFHMTTSWRTDISLPFPHSFPTTLPLPCVPRSSAPFTWTITMVSFAELPAFGLSTSCPVSTLLRMEMWYHTYVYCMPQIGPHCLQKEGE